MWLLVIKGCFINLKYILFFFEDLYLWMIEMCEILVNFLLNVDWILDCKGKGDVVFILDIFGSVGCNGFYKVLNFMY